MTSFQVTINDVPLRVALLSEESLEEKISTTKRKLDSFDERFRVVRNDRYLNTALFLQQKCSYLKEINIHLGVVFPFVFRETYISKWSI